MEIAVKHSVTLRGKSSGNISRKGISGVIKIHQCVQHGILYHSFQPVPVDKKVRIQDALSAPARKLQASKNIQLETVTTRTTITESTIDDSNILPSRF